MRDHGSDGDQQDKGTTGVSATNVASCNDVINPCGRERVAMGAIAGARGEVVAGQALIEVALGWRWGVCRDGRSPSSSSTKGASILGKGFR